MALVNDDVYSAVYDAAKDGDFKRVKKILRDCKYNALADELYSVLVKAKSNNHFEIIDLFLRHGVPIDWGNYDSYNGLIQPIYFATAKNDTAMLDLLIERGANIDDVSLYKLTPLIYATITRKMESLEHLLIKGANVNQKIKLTWSLTDILSTISYEVRPDEDQFCAPDATALHIACMTNNEAVQILLNHGADIFAKDARQSTVLHYASRNNFTGASEILIKNGADILVNETDSCQNTPLYIACQRNIYDTVKVLLKYGADVRPRNNEGYTALDIATYYCRDEMVRKLLKHGAEVNALSKRGSPLQICLAPDRYSRDTMIDTAYELLKFGADINVANSNGQTPICVAALKNDSTLFHFLLEFGADYNITLESNKTLLYIHAKSNPRNLTIAKTILAKGADVNVKADNGKTALWWTVDNGNTALFKLLVENGADTSVTLPETGETLLHIVYGSDIAEILLKKGCDPNAKDNKGITPFEIVLAQGNSKTSNILLAFGGDINAILNPRPEANQVTTSSGSWNPDFCRNLKFRSSPHYDAITRNQQGYAPHFKIKYNVIVRNTQKPHVVNSGGVDIYAEDTSDGYQEYLQETLDFTIEQFCLYEIAKLKVEKLSDSSRYPLFNYLTNDLNNLANYVKNDKLYDMYDCVDNSVSTELTKRYPMYAVLIKRNLIIGKERINLLESSSLMKSSCSFFMHMPDVCFRMVLNYLPNPDLKMFVENVCSGRSNIS